MHRGIYSLRWWSLIQALDQMLQKVLKIPGICRGRPSFGGGPWYRSHLGIIFHFITDVLIGNGKMSYLLDKKIQQEEFLQIATWGEFF